MSAPADSSATTLTKRRSKDINRLEKGSQGSIEGFPDAVRKALAALSIPKRRFVMAYCSKARGNGTLAVQIAGIGGTYARQASVASTFLHEPLVRAAIDAWMEAYAMSSAELTYRIAEMTEVNPGPFTKVNKDGTLEVKVLSEQEWEAYKHWVKEIEADPKTGKVTRVRLHDSMDAKRELAKIRKLYSDAPITNFNFYLQQMSDEQLLKELEEARSDEHGERALPPGPPLKGEPVAVIAAPPPTVVDHQQEQ